MSKPKRIAAAKPLFSEGDIATATAAIADVLRGGRLILGPHTRKFEAAVCERVGVEHAVALSSCTAALEVAYRHAGVAGREVVVPTNTFVATAGAAIAAGGLPVFADMSPDDFGLDVDDAMRKVTEDTAAVVVVHVAGFVVAGIDRLRSFCEERSIALIEDCAHAHGAKLGDREVGSLGTAGCYSFYPTKIITSGTGGVLTTNDAELAALARSLRHHGQGESLETVVNIGNDWVLDEVRAVLANVQFARLDEFVAERRRLAARYDDLLGGIDGLSFGKAAPNTTPVYYKYPVLLPTGVDAKVVRTRMLEEHEVEVGALYSPPVHQMPAYAKCSPRSADVPVAEKLLPRQITLPMHGAITNEDVDRSVQCLKTLLEDMS